MLEAVRSIFTTLANMAQGLYASGQSAFGDLIINAVIIIVVLVVIKGIFDACSKAMGSLAITTQSASNGMTAFSNVCLMVVVVMLMVIGVYKSDNITSVDGNVGETNFSIGVTAPAGYDLENVKNPLKKVPRKEKEYSLTDEEINQYYFALQDSIDNSRKEAVEKEPTKIQKSGFWGDLSEIEEGLQKFFGLDGNFKKKKK